MIDFDDDRQDQRLDQLRLKEEEDVAKILATRYGVGYVDLTPVPINAEALRVIDEKTARENKMAVFNIVGKKIQVAVLSPKNDSTMAVIRDLTEKGFKSTVYMVSMRSLEKVWKQYADLSFSENVKAGSLDISSEEIDTLLKDIRDIDDVKKLVDDLVVVKKTTRVSKILEVILAGAVAVNASDVHLEPEEAYVRLRYRLDGVLIETLRFDRDLYFLILSRIKLLSGMKLNVKTEAQDGRFSVKVKGFDIEIRVSILPEAYSETVVMRLLNPKSIAVPLEDLGIPKKLFDIFTREISRPKGLILNTGPTGSGKTTTLYAFLKKIHTPDIKIITIEDPVEYHLPGVVQTQTNAEKGYTFLEGLRSIMRQDPDVIMVGEIRDNETADIAINSALTGHLVFSTIHTNNAAGTFPRLIELGVNPRIISSSLSLAIAQRLARKLCESCKEEVVLTGKDKDYIEKVLNSIVDKTQMEGVQKEKMWKAHEKGCPKCNYTGYKGRIAIYEAIVADESIEKILDTNPTEREIKRVASAQGIMDMRQDGIIKILAGITDVAELGRVIDLDEEFIENSIN
ncbi:MAG: GspE/PulE family protein [Candidatus Paceibacterota bacterium]|jgi:type IV pilus assembly protein PilB